MGEEKVWMYCNGRVPQVLIVTKEDRWMFKLKDPVSLIELLALNEKRMRKLGEKQRVKGAFEGRVES